MSKQLEIEVRSGGTEHPIVLSVRGELSIATAAELRTALLHQLEAATPVLIDIADLSTIDLRGLQLLCSAHRTWLKDGLGFHTVHVGGAVLTTARTAGYHASGSACPMGHEQNCFWRL